MFEPMTNETPQEITLYTDSHLVHGTIRTRQRRLSDVLNETDATFLVLEDVRFEEFGSRALIERAPYAHINLDTVLFGVAEQAIEATPEMRTIKVPEHALISVPPFRITGRIHLLPERDLRQALSELDGRFLPVTEAIYWSDRLNEARAQSPMLAFSHARAQILAPYQEHDVWAGVSSGPAVAEGPTSAAEPAGGWPAADLGRGTSDEQPPAAAGADPWRDLPGSNG